MYAQTQPTAIGGLILLVLLALVGIALGRVVSGLIGGWRDGRAGDELDRLFVGDRVRYTVTRSSMGYDTVMDGARQRGYRLADKDDRRKSAVVLTFDRA